VHAGAEHGQLVDGVVDLQREPREHDESQNREGIARHGAAAVVVCVGIDPHTPPHTPV
jgi:hypothetical protein